MEGKFALATATDPTKKDLRLLVQPANQLRKLTGSRCIAAGGAFELPSLVSILVKKLI